MSAGRVLATQQARDAAKQLIALTGPVKEQVRKVLHHGGVLADPHHWGGDLAGKWRHDWGRDANHLNQTVAKLDALEHTAQLVLENIFKADDALLAVGMPDQPPSDPPSLHDDLLKKYQVAPDPDGMTKWPWGSGLVDRAMNRASGLVNSAGRLANRAGGLLNRVPLLPDVPDVPTLPSSRSVTAGEAEMLNDLQFRQGLRGTKAAYDRYQEALHRSEKTFEGKGGTDGHADAFRHAYWNAMLAKRFGVEWAREYTTAHERNPDSHPTPVAMDLHNNEVGRRIFRENPDADEEELRSLVEQAVRDGEMVVVGTDNRLHHSNQVDLGDTRPTSEGNPWPTDNPQRREHRDPGEPDAVPEYY